MGDASGEGGEETSEAASASRLKRPKSLNVSEVEVETPVSLRGWFRGISYTLLWYGSIMMGFYSLYCPALPLLLINRSAYRKVTEFIFTVWESFAVALMELVYGIRFFMSGDIIRPGERSIILLNHRNRLDWSFLWGALAQSSSPSFHNCKAVLKSGIRNLPGLGWILQMSCYLYIHRRWDEDQELMSNILDYFKDIDHTFQVMLFPEGTNLTQDTKKKSDEFAQKSGLPSLINVLHPRTTGFIYLVNKLRSGGQLDAVYDVTVMYPRTLPISELDIIKGRLPEEVHFNIKRHHASTIPSTDEGLKSWLSGIWIEKDELLKITLSQGHFPGYTNTSPPPANGSYLSLLLWMPLTFGMAYLICTSLFVQLWCLAFTVFFVIVSVMTDGLQHFEVWLYRREMSSQKSD